MKTESPVQDLFTVPVHRSTPLPLARVLRDQTQGILAAARPAASETLAELALGGSARAFTALRMQYPPRLRRTVRLFADLSRYIHALELGAVKRRKP